VPQDDPGDAGDARAHRIEGAPRDVRDVEQRGQSRLQVRVRGQQRRAAGRARRRDGPRVRPTTGRQPGLERRLEGAQETVGRRHVEAGRRQAVAGVGRIQLERPLRPHRRQQPLAQQLGVPVEGKREQHEPRQRERVLGVPRLGRVAGERVLRRQRIQRRDRGVHPARVRVQQGALLAVQARVVATRAVGQPEATHEAVAGHQARAAHLGQPPCREAAQRVHLEQPVLRVHEPDAEHRIRVRGGAHVRHAEVIAGHIDRGLEATHLERALESRVRASGVRERERPPDARGVIDVPAEAGGGRKAHRARIRATPSGRTARRSGRAARDGARGRRSPPGRGLTP
jgi:hypothetical protein